MSLIARTLLALPVLGAASVIPRGDQNISSIFEPGLSPGASIYYPSDPDFATETTQRWSTYSPPSFVATIKPVTDEDIQNIVKIANENHIRFFATGGGHQAEPGYASVVDTVNIDLGSFQTKQLDAAANTFTTGPNVTFIEIFDVLYDAGKELPVGNAPCVSLIGATIGAGVGPLQGLHGPVLDSLRSVKIVTADGDLLIASKTENPDLFWAVRGAGANFGIITEAVYEVYPATNNGQLVNADFIFNPASNQSLWEVLKTWDEDGALPKELGMTLAGGYNHTTNQPTLSATVSYFGTQEAFQPYLDKFLALNPPTWRNLTIPWPQLDLVASFGNGARACTRGLYYHQHHIGTRVTDVPTFTSVYNQWTDFVGARPWFNGAMVIQRYGAETGLAVPEEDRGAYPWRDIRDLWLFNHIYDGPQHDDEVNTFFSARREELFAVSGFSERRIYVNYASGDEGPEAWFGPSLPRLTGLKQQYDPDNKFGPGNPIIPSS